MLLLVLPPDSLLPTIGRSEAINYLKWEKVRQKARQHLPDPIPHVSSHADQSAGNLLPIALRTRSNKKHQKKRHPPPGSSCPKTPSLLLCIDLLTPSHL
jgi:hypothetical protein